MTKLNGKNEYLHVNAKVKGTKIDNGFRFDGAGKGAKWLVSEDYYQPYNFGKSGFTVAAIVKIDGVSNDNRHNSVMGVGVNENTKTKSIGLRCTNDGKWAVSGGEEEKTNIPCEQNNVYIVATTLNEGNIVFYADWEMLENTQNEK